MSHRILLFVLAMAATTTVIAQNTDNVTEPQKYKGCQTLTEFDSTNVFMEESGLSLIYGHKRIHMLDYAGCSANSVVKMDYDPLSAYVEIQKVLVHRYYSGKTDTIVANGKGTVYDYIAPARLI